jgi:putative PIN family toxin of toxin-antitoxin system
MRILCDTNVIVSAFATSGSCHDVIDHAIHHHELLYTPAILHECESVFKNKFQYPESFIDKIASFIKKRFIEGKTAVEIDKVCRDHDDDYVLADALINNINVIITGDKDLLELRIYKDIRIINPKEYWNL